MRALFAGTIARSLNMGLMCGIMLGAYGTMKGAALQRLGYLPADDPAPSSRPPRKPRLQSWFTHGWEDDAPPPEPPAAAPTPTPSTTTSEGFIKFGVPLLDPSATWWGARPPRGEAGGDARA